jgi:Na+/pantothenate symporter
MMGVMTTIFAQTTGTNSALVAFVIYTILVFVIAAFAGRLLTGRGFLGEYFLGSRGLGMWAFAMTFAATSSSGGSFMGFPSLIYTHGWVLAFWIGGYMVVPLVMMGLLGKRINQVARKTGAITVPDLICERFASTGLGALTTLLIVFFMSVFLIGQFKAGALILQTLLQDVPLFQVGEQSLGTWLTQLPLASGQTAGYLLCLLGFAIAVIAYTCYGGFHAVVWTDVMQGIVMGLGVIIMFFLAIWQVGGLSTAVTELEKMTPPHKHHAFLETSTPVEKELLIPFGTWIAQSTDGGATKRMFRTAEAALLTPGSRRAQASQRSDDSKTVKVLEITTPEEIARIQPDPLPVPIKIHIDKTDDYAYGANQPGVYLRAPGPHETKASGFLPLTLAISFFLFWPLIGAGQPAQFVRLMAFNNSRTFVRAIVTVTLYYSAIYIPLVIIFTIARVMLPGMEIEADRIMPAMAVHLTTAAHMPWLAGLVVAAAFAAVMSTVDSLLLLVSSAMVRDIYQRHINPSAKEKTLRWLTYAVTLTIGVAAVVGALNPPEYLQYLIIYAGGGMGVALLVPVGLGLYWPRFNSLGAVAAMLGGFCPHVTLYVVGTLYYGRFEPIKLWDFDPIIPSLALSLVLGVAATYCAPPTSAKIIDPLFYRDS